MTNSWGYIAAMLSNHHTIHASIMEKPSQDPPFSATAKSTGYRPSHMTLVLSGPPSYESTTQPWANQQWPHRRNLRWQGSGPMPNVLSLVGNLHESGRDTAVKQHSTLSIHLMAEAPLNPRCGPLISRIVLRDTSVTHGFSRLFPVAGLLNCQK